MQTHIERLYVQKYFQVSKAIAHLFMVEQRTFFNFVVGVYLKMYFACLGVKCNISLLLCFCFGSCYCQLFLTKTFAPCWFA